GLRNGGTGLRRRGDRPGDGPAQRPHPGGPGSRGTSDRMLGADRRRDASPGLPGPDRRPRYAANCRAHLRADRRSLAVAPAGQPAYRLEAVAALPGQSRAAPPQGTGPTAARAGPALVDTVSARAYNRCKLLRHGGHLRTEEGKLRGVTGSGPVDARTAPQ